MTLALMRTSSNYMLPKSQSEQRPPFARWLIENRRARGWSQDNLVDNAEGITQGYISSLERGVRQPSRDIVKLLARALYMGEDDSDYARFEAWAMEAAGYVPDNEEYAGRMREAMVIAETYLNRPKSVQDIVKNILYTNMNTGETLTYDDIMRITGNDKE